MSKNKFGWVLYDTDVNLWVDRSYNASCRDVVDAKVFATREKARKHKLECDRVKRVLVIDGTPVEVVKGR